VKLFQTLPSKCSCALCDAGCYCGDCANCMDRTSDAVFVRNVKIVAVICFVLLTVGGFMTFAPVVSVAAATDATVSLGPSVRVQTTNETTPLGSITFCYLGQGAVLVNGTYYPDAIQNGTGWQNASKISTG
jgi:hypothetical protein